MERLTQYTSDGVAESYIGESDNINIYKGGMEDKYISGRQITKLAEYEDIGLTPQEIIELRDDATELFNENKELKKHASKYINMERVEKLSLPFWSEVIKKSGEWSLIFKRYGCEYLLNFVIDDKGKNWISLFINHKNNKKPKFAELWSSELTQENYAKACEIIKKIWENGDAV